jgi:DNA-binding FadR family transcriptional regulator
MPRPELDSDLLEYIVKSNFKPGDRLPTINVLQGSEHLGVSISKVREQLEVARALGIVEVRSKTGMKLRDYSFAPAVRLSLFYALAVNPQAFELFTALRNHIEVSFWHEACALLTDADRQAMHGSIAAARTKLSPRNGHIHIPNEEHRAFHLRVFTHLDNPFVMGILEAYWDAYEAVESSRYADYAYHTNVWDYHERILEAICAGDYDRAQQLFIDHTQLRHLQHSSVNGTVEVAVDGNSSG